VRPASDLPTKKIESVVAVVPLHQRFDPTVRYLFVPTLALIIFGLACEIWLAPLYPQSRGSFLILKVVPLCLLLPGLWKGKFRSLQWLSLIILVYVAEGSVRGMSDAPNLRYLGWIGVVLSTLIFALTMQIASWVKKKP
jgi:uncharacterized membrane protein